VVIRHPGRRERFVDPNATVFGWPALRPAHWTKTRGEGYRRRHERPDSARHHPRAAANRSRSTRSVGRLSLMTVKGVIVAI